MARAIRRPTLSLPLAAATGQESEMTPEQVADLQRAAVMVDRARAKVAGVPVAYPLTKRLENLLYTFDACLGNVITNDRAAYDAGQCLYDQWWPDRWDEDKVLDEKRDRGGDRLPQEG